MILSSKASVVCERDREETNKKGKGREAKEISSERSGVYLYLVLIELTKTRCPQLQRFGYYLT